MPSRHRSRESAVQMIFQWEQSKAPVEQVSERYWATLTREHGGQAARRDPFADRLLEGVASGVERIDELIRGHSANWRLERMSAVDRSILRMAVFEMINDTAAPAVVINEAMEIGRRFSGDEACPFLNGVLDAIRKSLIETKVP